MAAVTRVRPLFVSPVGYEVFDKGTVTEAILAGQLVKQTAAGWSLNPTTNAYPSAVAAKPYYLGQGGCDFLIQGEMDGFSGLTAGDPLYPSSTVAGGIDTTAFQTFATTPAVTATPQMRAATSTRIRFNFV